MQRDSGACVWMIGNAHIDPVWIWDWHEGMHEVLQTFRAAADRLDENPQLIFSASSSAFYRWVELVDEDLFRRVRDAVDSGRWVLTGGQWVEPDCNLPSGESVCRQFLYGQRYLAASFGTTATVGWNIDSFGHAGTLPQLFVRSGLRGYVMMRPDEAEKPFPSPVFRWQGVDGTELPTYRVPFAYSTEGRAEDQMLRDRAADLVRRSEELGFPLMCLFGVGDHGGGPTRLAIRTVRDLRDSSNGGVNFGGPDSYFAELDEGALPALTGELQWHSVGCYSARASVKKANASAEQALATAERMASLCFALTGRELGVNEQLGNAWKALLFSQFHDALGGTCSEAATEGIDLMVAEARAVADRITTLASHSIAQHVDTWTVDADCTEGLAASALAGTPIPAIVYNPLSWPITATVSIPYPIAQCRDENGNMYPVQHVASGEATFTPLRTLLRLPLPAFGFRRWWLHALEAEQPKPPPGGPTTEGYANPASAQAPTILTNGHLRVEVDPMHGLAMLTDDRDGRQWLSGGGMGAVVIEDSSDTWSHGVDGYRAPEEPWQLLDVGVVEDGPVRSTVRASFRFAHSTLTQDISLYGGHDFVEIALNLDWHESHHLVKFVVPLELDNAMSAAGAPYGFVERSTSGHEEPLVGWVALFERDGTAGMCCTTDSSYGYDAFGSRLRFTLLRSPRAADHGAPWGADDAVGYPILDQGAHRSSLRLHPYAGKWADVHAARLAEEHKAAPPIVLDTWHRGDLGPEASALDITEGSVTVPVVKRSENGSGTVVRVWETSGRSTAAKLTLPPNGRCWEAELGPHELRTLFVPDDPADDVRTIDIPELNLDEFDGTGTVDDNMNRPWTPSRTS